MIEKFSDLELKDAQTAEDVDSLLKEKLGISLDEMRQSLSTAVLSSASDLAETMFNIAPLGDYSKLLEDQPSMVAFIKEEAHKAEHWKLVSASISPVKQSLIVFTFNNQSIDDGDVMKGYAYVSFQGKIKHAFAQCE